MSRTLRWIFFPSLVAACAFGGPVAVATAGRVPASVRSSAERPTLVVFFTVDQFRGAYLARYGSAFRGGLKRLMDGGAVFANGFQDTGSRKRHPVTRPP